MKQWYALYVSLYSYGYIQFNKIEHLYIQERNGKWLTTINIFQWICVAIIQPSKLKKKGQSTTFCLHRTTIECVGAMLFCPGVTFCRSKQNLKLYESPTDKQIRTKSEKNHEAQPGRRRTLNSQTFRLIVTILRMLMTWRCNERGHHMLLY